jgi:uncharacterized protein (DUF427 family)
VGRSAPRPGEARISVRSTAIGAVTIEGAEAMTRDIKLPGPEHPITIEPSASRVVVRVGAQVVADTTSALALSEAGYPPVHYIPLADVDQSMLRRTDNTTYCPYKGDCSYYTLTAPGGDLLDAVWTYEHPYPAVASIVGHVAFYPDRVQLAVGDEA